MSLRIPSLSILVLAGTLLAAPLPAAEPKAPPVEKLEVSKTAALDSNDPLYQWFKEQDKLLDEILMRLARIENLVSELHRLISQLPGGAPAPAPKPAMPVPTIPPVQAKPSGILGFFDDWGVELASIGVLILGTLMFLRHRRDRQRKNPSPAPARKPAAAPPVAPRVAAPAPIPAAPKNATPIAINQNDQAIELAEIMLSMGLGHGAAQTLIEQIRREPRQALLHWLKLLEIYRKNGQQDEFERSAEELRKHFNVQPEDWHASSAGPRSIEEYPHIAARIVELWGKPDCLVYLQNLLDDNRGGARAGFPQSVAEELVLLTTLRKTTGTET